MIRTSKHYFTKDINLIKHQDLKLLLQESRKCLQFYIDYIWNNLIINNTCPKMISTVDIPIETKLSARILKCLATQSCGIVRSVLKKKKKSKPIISNIPIELNSICVDIKYSNHFDNFIQLKCIGNKKKIRIPIKQHRQSNKWKALGKQLNSYLINDNFIEIRYEIKTKVKTEGIVLGADQGQLTCLTLSDGQVTKFNKDGYDLNKIQNVLTRKKKGSKAFKKTQEHRKNYINWSINQLNLNNVKELRLEKIFNIRKYKNVGRKLSHWVNTLIKGKVERVCQEKEVLFVEQSCSYRSQRCSSCGIVLKSNRKNKVYSCKLCSLNIDADFNASLNHSINLPEVPIWLRLAKLNISGFYWLDSGFFSLLGSEFTVPINTQSNT